MIDQTYFEGLSILAEEHFAIRPSYDSQEIFVMAILMLFVGVSLLIGGGLL